VHDGIALLRDKIIVSHLSLGAYHVLLFLRNPITDFSISRPRSVDIGNVALRYPLPSPCAKRLPKLVYNSNFEPVYLVNQQSFPAYFHCFPRCA
jgi:hypothetical protein